MTATTGLKSFLFSLGNSTDGAVGYCTRIIAHTPAEAVTMLRACVDGMKGYQRLDMRNAGYGDDAAGHIEYFHVYFNPDRVTEADIEESEDYDPDADA